ncbi:GntR family transcriptional regulator [Actinoplanes sp. LDG1-06]|uniref:GntR family transcriptional regulator n=1 Tax=Paractinoplanes ovalisporus TaxID=2810368 RepID=A0ABS2A8Q2_9ACTN|nr:GntR family transcriptional regulator [Actinoplanes ovalisporus]MBM2615683.1 GntR family transcriptional regulator [Actinoplanes ovalisporus]
MSGQYSSEAQRCYNMLRDRILDGRYAEGAVLNQLEIAQEFGTSRSPVREAIARLAADRLVTDIPGRGARVATLSVQDYLEVNQLRWLLESFAARVAAGHMPMELIEDFRTRLARIEEPGELEALDQELHRAIAEHCGNERMREYIAQLNGMMTIARRRDVAGSHDDMLGGLRELLEAFAVRDADRAELLMRDHIGSFTTRLPGLMTAPSILRSLP